jgi:hypothetical protein
VETAIAMALLALDPLLRVIRVLEVPHGKWRRFPIQPARLLVS